MDPYFEIFNQLDLYVYNRSINETFAELGGIVRGFPLLENTVIKSCHISHFLSNNLEQKWVRALHVSLTSSLKASAVHDRFRNMGSKDLTITFASDDETVLCTEFSREVIKAEAFDGSDSTNVFLSSQLSGFDMDEALSFLANPLGELAKDTNMVTRLVGARSSRTAEKEQSADRMLEQRWTVADVESAIQSVVDAADGGRWAVEQHLQTAEAGPTARLRHVPSGDVVKLDAKMGHGQLELRAARL
ncbi:MAG: hypothetical protein AB8G95_17245 [Anaerolineae bacterium]